MLVGDNMEYKLKKFIDAIKVSRIANIHYFEFTNEFKTRKESHPFTELVYVDSNSISVESDDYCGVIGKNQMILHRSMETHSLTCPTNQAPEVIIIGFECKSELLNEFSNHPITLTVEQQRMLSEIVKEGRKVFMPPYDKPYTVDMKKRRSYAFGADQLIKIWLEMLLISLVRSRSMAVDSQGGEVLNEKMAAVKEYLDEHVCEKITLDELVFMFGTNKTTLCSDFKKCYGMTVQAYADKLRLREARRRLREGKENITQISQSLGFSSVHYFCRFFKKHMNQSPLEYIKTVKSKLEQ